MRCAIKRYWIKLWLDILNDPKMGQLPDWLWRRAIELFLLAGENGDDGLLQPVTDLAWRLRPCSEEQVTKSLRALAEVGVVHETPEGWVVTNFEKRQEAVSSTERVRQFRKRKGNALETKRFKECNENETVVVAESASASVSVSPSDSVSEEGGTGGETGNVFTVYENNIGMLTPFISDALKDDETTYSPVWVCAAIQEAVKSEARNLRYVEAILKRWKRDGFKSARSDGKRQSSGESVEEHNRRVVKESVYGKS